MMRTFATLLLTGNLVAGFTNQPLSFQHARRDSSVSMMNDNNNDDASATMDRRAWFTQAAAAVVGTTLPLGTSSAPAAAQVFFDPAQYGDQELRVGAVDSLRESVRRAILQDPQLVTSFYQLALLDGLSFDAKTNKYGPDSSIVKVVLSSKETDTYTANLQKAALALIEAEKVLRRKTAITLADAIAVGGAESIESVGGPILTVQLGRADAPLQAPVADVPLDLFNSDKSYSNEELTYYFRRSGMTEREMTALLSGLLTLEKVEKSRSGDDWRASTRPKFREAGKIGRMSEFRRLTDEDIAEMEAQAELDADPEFQAITGDDGWYIADSFGTRDSRFGDRLGKDQINEKTFNKYIKEVMEASKKKGDLEPYGWLAPVLLDPQSPTSSTWLNKYASSNLNYVKDLSISFNSLTQLGAVYTGGKYENLLKNKPRKSLNNDDLNLF